MTEHSPRHPGRLLALAGAFCVAAAGCHQFSLLPTGFDRPAADRAEKAKDREPIPGTPSKHAFPVSQFVFVADFDVQRNLPVFKELSDLREQVYRELRLPPSNTKVFVYLFEDQEKYERFMRSKYPDLPKRRAFFVAQPRRLGGPEDLLVYTYWGHRIHQDLRHELTHALLHSVLKDVPLWLDEGLAEYFEVPAGWNGVNMQHVEHLRQAGAKHDLARLEHLSDVQQMTPGEYREAWAWVHLMLRSTPQARQVLIGYLQELRANPQPGLLRPRLTSVFLVPESAVDSHLAELEDTKVRARASQQ
jgi:hypothetical protein